jgi:hypothetical protein
MASLYVTYGVIATVFLALSFWGLRILVVYPDWVPLYAAPAGFVVGYVLPMWLWALREMRHPHNPGPAFLIYFLLSSSFVGAAAGYVTWRFVDTQTTVIRAQ